MTEKHVLIGRIGNQTFEEANFRAKVGESSNLLMCF